MLQSCGLKRSGQTDPARGTENIRAHESKPKSFETADGMCMDRCSRELLHLGFTALWTCGGEFRMGEGVVMDKRQQHCTRKGRRESSFCFVPTQNCKDSLRRFGRYHELHIVQKIEGPREC